MLMAVVLKKEVDRVEPSRLLHCGASGSEHANSLPIRPCAFLGLIPAARCNTRLKVNFSDIELRFPVVQHMAVSRPGRLPQPFCICTTCYNNSCSTNPSPMQYPRTLDNPCVFSLNLILTS
jgi:hypothetical protein